METTTPQKKFGLSTPLAIIIAGAFIALAIVVTNLQPVTPPSVDAEGLAPTTVRGLQESDHVYGSREAEVFLIEYSDLQCPFCAQIHDSLQQIVDESDGEVAWILRHFPLTSIHPDALPAALASECIAELAGETAFWAYTNAALASQGSLSDAFYLAMASQAGIAAGDFNACYTSKRHQARVADDFAEAVGSGGQGTPYVVVQKGDAGVSFSGALPYLQIKALVDSVVAR